jgi:integrative and conjugative element protein (TIGR02256 family)
LTDPDPWSAGQRLAHEQLAALAQADPTAIEIVNAVFDDAYGKARFDISLDLNALPHAPDGIVVRDRERFEIFVPSRFPHEVPTVRTPRPRWAGSPHVQWGRQLCLYAAPSTEWSPSDGMRGYIDRLRLWLAKAALGELDPDGQPLHPPVAYPRSSGTVVVHADLGGEVPWAPGSDRRARLMVALCEQDGDRLDVVRWLDARAYNALRLLDNVPRDSDGRPYAVAGAVLVDTDLGFEYPNTVPELLAGLAAAGVSDDDLFGLMSDVAWWNFLTGDERGVPPFSEGLQPHGFGGVPLRVLLGAPARRLADGSRLAHLVAWEVSESAAIVNVLSKIASDPESQAKWAKEHRDWSQAASLNWVRVFEQRPEVTARRDGGSPAAWLQGKRVLVLGAGALGGPIAESCVRAGTAHVTIVDTGVVTPGILVRQPYADADVGKYKSQVLAARLRTVRRAASVDGDPYDALEYLRPAVRPDFDLIVDATADASVRAALEHARNTAPDKWPPVVTVLVGHDARRGIMALSRSDATGAGHHILRRLGIAVRTTHADALADVAEDFYPAEPRTVLFFPEPGCSAPTFVGSAAEATALASGLLSAALDALAGNGPAPSSQPMSAAVVRLDPPLRRGRPAPGSGTWLGWPNDAVLADTDGRYAVSVSPSALATVRAEARRAARLFGPAVETGGMLFGQIDDATGTVYVDVATRPTPDSRLSTAYFEHGVDGAQELLRHHRDSTNGRSGFVGMWHTHPHGRAVPSPTDAASMANFVAPVTGGPPRSLILIVGGDDGAWPAWLEHRGAEPPVLPQMYAALVRRGDPAVPPPPLRPAPPGTYYSGGWAPTAAAAPVRRRSHWWRRHRRAAR